MLRYCVYQCVTVLCALYISMSICVYVTVSVCVHVIVCVCVHVFVWCLRICL
jgi:hypothetical protein